jgi:hypothetical protein
MGSLRPLSHRSLGASAAGEMLASFAGMSQNRMPVKNDGQAILRTLLPALLVLGACGSAKAPGVTTAGTAGAGGVAGTSGAAGTSGVAGASGGDAGGAGATGAGGGAGASGTAGDSAAGGAGLTGTAGVHADGSAPDGDAGMVDTDGGIAEILKVRPSLGCGHDPGQAIGIPVKGTIATMGTKAPNCADSNCVPWSYLREYYVTLPEGYDKTKSSPPGPGTDGRQWHRPIGLHPQLPG